jgi:hypothetical protein
MATWSEFEAQAPALAPRVQQALDAHLHKLIATLRRDGAPRLSGIEVTIGLGQLWLGMMADSTKGRDLLRDPRFALHSAPIDLELKQGDAKLSGRATLVTNEAELEAYRALLKEVRGMDVPGPMDLFRADVFDASIVTVEGDELVIDAWRADEAPRQTRRK